MGETYFRDFLQKVCQIDANDTALESYGKCATFLYRNVFLIPYSLEMNLNTVKFDFERDFFKSLSKPVENKKFLKKYNNIIKFTISLYF